MATPAAVGKAIVNALHHGSMISGLTIGYSKLGSIAMGGLAPKLDFTPHDAGMVVVDVAFGMARKDALVIQLLIPADILQPAPGLESKCRAEKTQPGP